jgi:hypothetical protein
MKEIGVLAEMKTGVDAYGLVDFQKLEYILMHESRRFSVQGKMTLYSKFVMVLYSRLNRKLKYSS